MATTVYCAVFVFLRLHAPRRNSRFIPVQYLAHSHHHRPARSPTRCAPPSVLRGVPLRLSYEGSPSICLTRCASPSVLRGVPLRLSYEVCPPYVLRGVSFRMSYEVCPPYVLRGVPLHMSYEVCLSTSSAWCTSASVFKTIQYLAHSHHHLSTVQGACLLMRVCCSTSGRNRARAN